jgi:uncharacterized protein (DUF362 family)
MDRRQFVKAGFTAVAASLLPLGISLGQESQAAEEATGPAAEAGADSLAAAGRGPVVWEIEGGPAKTVETLFTRLGGLKKLIAAELDKASILIKPNLCLPHPPGMATTTSPDLIDALCDYLLSNGIKRVHVADHTLQKASSFEKCAMVKAVEKHKDAKMILANEERWFDTTEVRGKVLKETATLKLLGRADLLINVATAKHHSATTVSLAAKNLMGMIWDRSAFHTKMDLHQAIGDLALAIRPDINIIDASRVLLSGGPTGPGPVTKDNRIFASSDLVAVDAVVASRYNFGGKSTVPRDVRHLWAAHGNGVGEIDLEKITILKI